MRIAAVSLPNGRRCAIALAVLVLSVTQANAWDVSVGISSFEGQFFPISVFTGSPTATPLTERVYADSGPGTIPNSWMTQSWDGSAWPAESIEAEEGLTTFAALYNNTVNDELPDSMEAAVFGEVPPGLATGAGFGYDFELVVDAFSFVQVDLDGGGYIYLESEPGDVGFAFGSIKLINTDVGLEDFGGPNNPYDIANGFLEAGNPIVDMNDLALTHKFTNDTASPMTYNLRVQGSASVFNNIPEPISAALLSLAGPALLSRRRRRA